MVERRQGEGGREGGGTSKRESEGEEVARAGWGWG